MHLVFSVGSCDNVGTCAIQLDVAVALKSFILSELLVPLEIFSAKIEIRLLLKEVVSAVLCFGRNGLSIVCGTCKSSVT